MYLWLHCLYLIVSTVVFSDIECIVLVTLVCSQFMFEMVDVVNWTCHVEFLIRRMDVLLCPRINIPLLYHLWSIFHQSFSGIQVNSQCLFVSFGRTLIPCWEKLFSFWHFLLIVVLFHFQRLILLFLLLTLEFLSYLSNWFALWWPLRKLHILLKIVTISLWRILLYFLNFVCSLQL
jgi:hypothetical protein